jgi:putative lipoic acid-binding regulatory protein
MSALPPESAEPPSLLEFPCEFPLKILGRREDGFAQAVSEIVQRHAEDFVPSTIGMRASRNARFLSLTVTITARSKAQLDALYRELSAHPLVMMVL